MEPLRRVAMDVAKIPKRMTLVASAPAPTGPDLAFVTIDYRDQTIALDDRRVPYYVGSAGPRIRALDGARGPALVTVTFYTGHVRSIYGATS